jgi:hypothetical protein
MGQNEYVIPIQQKRSTHYAKSKLQPKQKPKQAKRQSKQEPRKAKQAV